MYIVRATPRTLNYLWYLASSLVRLGRHSCPWWAWKLSKSALFTSQLGRVAHVTIFRSLAGSNERFENLTRSDVRTSKFPPSRSSIDDKAEVF